MYIDALLDRKNDRIKLVLGDNFNRVYQNVPASYVFYYEHANGSHRSIYGHPCKKVICKTSYEFRTKLAEKRADGVRIFESDINPVFRYLSENFKNAETPLLNIGFFDIEADFHAERGYAPTDNPFNAVTAISLYRSADQTLLTFVLCPPTLDLVTAQPIAQAFPDTQLFFDERLMLEAFLDAIENVSVLTGWSSSQYDIPYLVNRVQRVISCDATRRFCLWDELPQEREYRDSFGKTIKSYELVGRVHLDYIELYRKHNTQQQLSYALSAIGEIEVGDIKTPYEGTLDALYKNDFRRFIEYNRQDVLLMVKIDEKKKFIELANQIAHANCVLLKTTMGSVALVEQAILNEMHMMGRVVPDRKPREERVVESVSDDAEDEDADDTDDDLEVRSPVVGAYVANPKIGLHSHIGAVDLSSLYPSTLRALNMSPETLIGQVRSDETNRLIAERVAKLTKTKRAEAWEGLFCTLEVQHMHDQDEASLTVDFFDHLTEVVTTLTMTGRELHDFIFDPAHHMCITANGTIFRTDVEGMIPALLTKWYAERQDYQRLAREWDDINKTANDPDTKLNAKKKSEFWEQRQRAKKTLLVSLYGAILNEAMRLNDERIGQSTTLTGRSIVRHMNAKVNEIITGVYDYKGETVYYSDTDSCYFSAYEFLKDQPSYADFDWSRNNVIELCDLIADETNATFPAFMNRTFNASLARGSIIKAGRELVASKGLFIRKKKYAVLIYDLEGKRQDVDGCPGKLKPMGLDLKRADTPRFMQLFLADLLLQILTGVDQPAMFEAIRVFREAFKHRPGWEKGTPKKVNNLTAFGAMMDGGIKLGMGEHKRAKDKPVPGHVRASLNWNKLCDMYQDRHVARITDSMRIIVCKLKPNSLGMTSIAYPIDEPHLPIWFRDLPFDHAAMEDTIIDAKLTNLVGVLSWDLSATKAIIGGEFFTF